MTPISMSPTFCVRVALTGQTTSMRYHRWPRQIVAELLKRDRNARIGVTGDWVLALAENLILVGQAACLYSWCRPGVAVGVWQVG
jgi:hypothetical protein